MRYFYATLALIAAVLLLVKPEFSLEIVTTGLVVAGIIMLLPTEQQ